MFEIGAGFIFFQAFIICALLYGLARREADYEFSTVALVTTGIIAGNFILFLTLFSKLGFFAIVPVFAFTCWMLVRFCWVSWPKGMLVTFLYFVLSIGFEYGKARLQQGDVEALTEDEQRLHDPQAFIDKQTEEGLREFEAINESTERMLAGTLPESEAPEPAEAATPAQSAPPPREIPAEQAARPAIPTPAPPIAVPSVATMPAAVVPADGPAISAAEQDWVQARSRLRIKGWLEEGNGRRVALVGSEMVAVGETAHVDWEGRRYVWRLAALKGLQPSWEPVEITAMPKP